MATSFDTDRFTPLLFAVLLAWILSVCVHEFAHALVAYLGGDRSVRERGYLTLDPTRFIDPVFSLLIPTIVLLMGGVPLPGGAVRIDESALKSRKWGLYVSAAGPASNFVLFLLFSLPLHPLLGLVDPYSLAEHPTWVSFFSAMAVLNFIATLFNLIPVPPLDGYRLIEHQLSEEMQWRLRQPGTSMMAFGVLFLIFATVDEVWVPFIYMLDVITSTLGLPADLMLRGYTTALYNA